jgi:hypothetical protein
LDIEGVVIGCISKGGNHRLYIEGQTKQSIEKEQTMVRKQYKEVNDSVYFQYEEAEAARISS